MRGSPDGPVGGKNCYLIVFKDIVVRGGGFQYQQVTSTMAV
jgi:hypothetical protein